MKTAIVSVCCNEANLEEWCHWHCNLGFDTIFVVLDNCSDEYLKSIEHLSRGKVHLVFDTQDTQFKIAPQFHAYNKFCAGNAVQMMYDWIAFLDLDEYLWLGGQSIQEFCNQHQDKSVVGINWKYFAAKDSSKLEEDIAEPSDSLLKRFTWCQNGKNKHVKCLVNFAKLKELDLLDRAYFVNPHLLANPQIQPPTFDECGNPIRGPYNESWTDDGIFIAHFYSKTKKEFEDKIRRGRPDCNRDSNAQYYRQVQRMWAERDRCNKADVEDTRLRDFLYGS